MDPKGRSGPTYDPFEELGLTLDVREEAGGVRVRQHVNPLASQFQVATPPLPWSEVFEDPTLPLVVDIGCGSGRMIMLLAKREEAKGIRRNYIGMEIRKPLTERANKWADLTGLGRKVHFIFTNATISFESILGSYPGKLDLVCVQFPDPHFKKRNHKRRVVQPKVARARPLVLLVRSNAASTPPSALFSLRRSWWSR